jgi:hypothetical protein
MSDIANNQKNTVGIENITSGNDLVVNSDGSINVAGIISNVPAATNVSQFVSGGKVFSLSAQLNMAAADSDNPLILIRNPSGSGKTLYLYRMSFGINVNNVNANFKLKHTPTITSNGTTATPVNTNIGHANTSVMNVYTLSTLSASGTQLNSLTVAQNGNTFDFLGDFSIWLPPGKDLVLTGDPSSNNRESSVTLVWAEV